jgi:hypothetical protein
MTTQQLPINDDLRTLHEWYVEAVNAAVAENRMDLVASLAREFDREAALLGAEDLTAA